MVGRDGTEHGDDRAYDLLTLSFGRLEHVIVMSDSDPADLQWLAHNIVNQIGDLLEAPVAKRQATNDIADAFVMKLIADYIVRRDEAIRDILIWAS